MEDGSASTKMLAMHAGPAHKIAIEPGSPCNFYSCGEDGAVMHVSKLSLGALTYIFAKSSYLCTSCKILILMSLYYI